MLVRKGMGAVATLVFGDYAGIFPTTGPNVGPPAPPQSLWTMAPPSEAQAQQTVQDISNQQIAAQMAANAANVQPSGDFLTFLNHFIPNWFLTPSGDGSSGTSCGLGCIALWLTAAGFVVAMFMTRRAR